MSKAEEIFNSLSDSPKSAASTLRDYAVDMEQENADLRAQLAAANMRVSELEGITAFDSALSEIEARGRRIAELARQLSEAREKAVPDGWQLVPKTLTPEMVMASSKAAPTEQAPLGYTQFAPNARWKAMLAAAPSASLNAKEGGE